MTQNAAALEGKKRVKSPGQLLFEAYVAVVYYGWTLGDGQMLFQWGDLYPRQQECWERMAKLYAESLAKEENEPK